MRAVHAASDAVHRAERERAREEAHEVVHLIEHGALHRAIPRARRGRAGELRDVRKLRRTCRADQVLLNAAHRLLPALLELPLLLTRDEVLLEEVFVVRVAASAERDARRDKGAAARGKAWRGGRSGRDGEGREP